MHDMNAAARAGPLGRADRNCHDWPGRHQHGSLIPGADRHVPALVTAGTCTATITHSVA
jgi:hypothetical protein